MSEKAIREAAERSGLDYTVVRPGSLTDAKRPKDACLVRTKSIIIILVLTPALPSVLCVHVLRR